MANKRAAKLYRFFFFFFNKNLPVQQAAAGFVSLQHPGAGGEPRGPAMCFHLAAAQDVMDETGLHTLLGEPLGSILPHRSSCGIAGRGRRISAINNAGLINTSLLPARDGGRRRRSQVRGMVPLNGTLIFQALFLLNATSYTLLIKVFFPECYSV